MKKLMIAAAAAVAVGGAFAEPLVYDYKASVKHMYEKLQNGTYVKYVKTSKLQGYFVQDWDSASLLSKTELAGAANSQKKGFLVLINKSAEKDYRKPKIMPAQLDVKTVVSKSSTSGATTKTKTAIEAYFYAGPFAAFLNTVHVWDPAYDAGVEWLFNNGTAAAGNGTRTYGTEGSTLHLFGQHNTFNRYIPDTDPAANNNVIAAPAAGDVWAFGDAWLNGAGFGNGSGSSVLCCGWGAIGGGGFNSISGNLKGGLFLCSLGGRSANTKAGYFTLGVEDLFARDVPVGGAPQLGIVTHGDNNAVAEIGTAEEPGADIKVWADGELVLSTTDVVSGSWSLKSTKKFAPVELTAAEQAFFASWANPGVPALLETIKGANQKLDKNYSFTTTTEPWQTSGKPTRGLISTSFQALYL